MRAFLRSDGLFQLGPKITTIGRDRCDLIVQSSSVDSQHALIEYRNLDDAYVLQDLGTTYGTYVNDCRIGDGGVRLCAGDVMRFGTCPVPYELVFEDQSQISYPVNVRHTAWQNGTPQVQQSIVIDPYAPTSLYQSSLPHLRTITATTTQMFANAPASNPLPKPPATMRNRPLSAGSRNRQFVDRGLVAGAGNFTTSRPGGAGWVTGGPTLLRSSSSTDLRVLQEQEDQKLAKLRDEVQRLSAAEQECKLKDQLIEQLYREREALHQQQGGTYRLPPSGGINGETDIAQRFMHLEREIIAKQMEIEQLKEKISESRNRSEYGVRRHSSSADSLAETSQLHAETHRLNSLLTQSQQTVAKKEAELDDVRHELEELRKTLRDKDSELSTCKDGLKDRHDSITELQHKLSRADNEIESQKTLVSQLKATLDDREHHTHHDKDALEKLRVQLEVSEINNQELLFNNTKLHDELTRLAARLDGFRRQVKQATCIASGDSVTADDDDDDISVMETLRQLVGERTKARAKVQKLKEKLSDNQKHVDAVHHAKEHFKDIVGSLASNGYYCRDLKLEIAALHATMARADNVESDELKSLFLQLLQGQLSWQESIESALETCGIDMHSSHEAPGHHIRDLHTRLTHAEQEVAHLRTHLEEARSDHQREMADALESQRHSMHSDFDARVEHIKAEHADKLHHAVNERETAEAAKYQEQLSAKQSEIARLASELADVKRDIQQNEGMENRLRSQLKEAETGIELFNHEVADLKQRTHQLEGSLADANRRTENELAAVRSRHQHELTELTAKIREHVETICTLEENLDKVTTKTKEYQAEIASLKSTISELSSRVNQHQQSPPVRPQMIIQPAVQSPLNLAAMSQLQHDNVDLKRQLHEQADVVIALRHELAGARAKMSDITGEVSETQKQELEHYQETVKRQNVELVEVRQQLAKLSEIVDRQTDDMKQLNAEAAKQKAAVTKYKNKLNEKEAQLKETEDGLHKVKHESTTKLNAVEDEGRASSELALCGAKCRGERHEQVILRQRDALVELRSRIKALEMGNTSPLSHDEAILEVIMLRQQLADLQLRVAVPTSSSSFSPAQLLGFGAALGSSQPLTPSDLSEALELSENLYLSLIRAIGSVLELEDMNTMTSIAHAPRDERLRLAEQREQECERVIGELRRIKDRIERKEELLKGYERDLASLRRLENITELTCGEKETLIIDLRKKCELIEQLREELEKRTHELEFEKRQNAAIKRKEYPVRKDIVDHAKGFPKHFCPPEDPMDAVAARKEKEKQKRKNYEKRMLPQNSQKWKKVVPVD